MADSAHHKDYRLVTSIADALEEATVGALDGFYLARKPLAPETVQGLLTQLTLAEKLRDMLDRQVVL